MLPSDSHTILAIDTETHTPKLKTHGPMGVQGEDYAIGVSIAAPDGFRAYYPLRHSEGNGPPNVLSYLRGGWPGPATQPSLPMPSSTSKCCIHWASTSNASATTCWRSMP